MPLQKKYDMCFMKMAREMSMLSQCLSRKVGCIITKNLTVIASGVNGNMPGTPHCIDAGVCHRQVQLNKDGTFKFNHGHNLNLCLAVHAEQNALMQICKNGSTSTRDATMYCTTFPCSPCLKLIVTAGIKRVCYNEDYKDELYDEMMKILAGKIEFCKVDYENAQ